MNIEAKEREACPICGGKGEVVVSCLIKRDGSIEPITVFQCQACGGEGVKRQLFIQISFYIHMKIVSFGYHSNRKNFLSGYQDVPENINNWRKTPERRYRALAMMGQPAYM